MSKSLCSTHCDNVTPVTLPESYLSQSQLQTGADSSRRHIPRLTRVVCVLFNVTFGTLSHPLSDTGFQPPRAVT